MAMVDVNMKGEDRGIWRDFEQLDVRCVSQGSHCLTVTSVHFGWYMSTPTAAPNFFERSFQNHSFKHFNFLGDIADDAMTEETDGTLLPWDKAMLLLADPPPPKQASIVSSHAGWYHMGPHPEMSMDLHDPEADLTEEGDPLLGHALICKMMFVSGETGDVSPETTSMIEGIVQQQVMEMLKRATDLAARRGVRTISTDDLIFLIRHDKAKVSRLRTFLSWKDVRKSAKDSDEKGGGGADAGGVEDFDLAANDPTLGTAGPSVGTRNSKNKKAKIGLPWDVSSFYSEVVPEREDEEDEEEEEMNAATLQRLKQADERTKGMNAEEYLHFSECRQASFTFRKGKRFREWAGFGVVTDSKPNDDIVDILGFLTYEIVTLLTEEALKVKAAEDALKRDSGGDEEKRGRKRRREPGLFDPPEEARTPVGPKHIQEAYRRLQKPDLKSRYMHHIPKGNWQRPLKLI
ncbi:TFIID-18kDa-domain-containing protein [Hortaea werneckii]|nr:TFIID-18kDa-domain-containing protein [Hortaea werneckii]